MQTQLESSYLALPKSGKGRAVLVLPSWWGLNDFFRGLCDRLSVEGYVALAPDWYQGQVATTIAQAKKLRNIKRKEPIYKGLIRAIEYLQEHPAVDGSSIAVIGFSMGAHWAFWLAAQPELPIRATVAFYGARACDFSQSHSVFQCHFAEHDEWVSAAGIKKLKKNLEAAHKPFEFYTYPGSTHWFFEQDRPEYQPQAAGQVWKRTIGFLGKHL